MQEFGGRARFVVENFGESALAKRFGVKRYPAIFVDDVLVATPKDFGFYGTGEGGGEGRYAPLRSVASHERFRADLTRMIERILAGRADQARALARPSRSPEIGEMPRFTLADLAGRTLSRDSLAGRPVIVEFWATWCPPCRGTLRWLGDLKALRGERVDVVAIAVESDDAAVRKLTAELGLPIRWAIAQPQVARAFGDLSAVPTLFLFDRAGRTAGVWYGATPQLHAEVEAALRPLTRD